MPRHRAPTSQSRALSTVAVTGAALGASVLSPAVAVAATAHGAHSEAGHTLHTAAHHHRHYRPMTSGEQQYRNGCRQGYISD
ncbi:MAG TPA: hypothetical protein VGP05_05705, partial [Pseudonocardia sp.]|nr:hypothetical protein [Pseudonocardia sp.]